jgi:hypothetical protein
MVVVVVMPAVPVLTVGGVGVRSRLALEGGPEINVRGIQPGAQGQHAEEKPDADAADRQVGRCLAGPPCPVATENFNDETEQRQQPGCRQQPFQRRANFKIFLGRHLFSPRMVNVLFSGRPGQGTLPSVERHPCNSAA